MIALTPIDHSGLIAAHGYHSTSGTLAVRLKSGKTYHHKDVPPEAAAAFASAQSLWSHWNSHIKGKFDTELQPADVEETQGGA